MTRSEYIDIEQTFANRDLFIIGPDGIPSPIFEVQ